MAETEYLRMCPNPKCGLVFRPDPKAYKDPENICPRCGADMNQPPAWKGRSYEQGSYD